MPRSEVRIDEVLPCRHELSAHGIDAAKQVLRDLPNLAPAVLAQRGIDPGDWSELLRAAVESLRGTASATTAPKRAFLEAIFEHAVTSGVFGRWEFIGSKGRQDYKVTLPDDTEVAIEAKGCGDGNNLTIWERPNWAREFVVWSQCPESLANEPGLGVWSAVATRLLPKIAADKEVVDAFVFFDARCGSQQRVCPKTFGISGLRSKATTILSDPSHPDWLPPPCIFLFPPTAPSNTNRRPAPHRAASCKFAGALLGLFGVPVRAQELYVNEVRIELRPSGAGTEIRPEIDAQWPDGSIHNVATGWKKLPREH